MSEKAGGSFWDLNDNQLVKFPTRITQYFEMEFVAELPREYRGDGLLKPAMLAYKDDRTGKDYLMFIKATEMPIRFNIEKNRFEKMESTADDRWEWRKYEEQ